MWIILSLTASVFFAFRQIIIKKYLSQVDVYLMAFAYRFFSIFLLIPLLFFFKLESTTPSFWLITFATSIFTALASILQIKALQKYDLSVSVPFLSFVPLFMIISVYVVYHELPRPHALLGILILVAGSFVLTARNGRKGNNLFKKLFHSKGSLYFFLVAIIFGLTSTIDRTAIEEVKNNGFTYTFYWHILSVFLFSFIFRNTKKTREYIVQVKTHFRGFVLQGIFGVSAFLLQMLAIENAFQLNANVLYIKSITLIQLLISTVFGLWLFKEKNAVNKLAGAIIMVAGAIIIILSRK